MLAVPQVSQITFNDLNLSKNINLILSIFNISKYNYHQIKYTMCFFILLK